MAQKKKQLSKLTKKKVKGNKKPKISKETRAKVAKNNKVVGVLEDIGEFGKILGNFI